MQTRPIQISDVIYNATSQSFEALVTVHDGDRTRKYACAIDAPITMSFRDAAKGLSTQALRRHGAGTGLASYAIVASPAPRAGRPARSVNRWLEPLSALLTGRAA